MAYPRETKIYHISHASNLSSILEDRALLSDRLMIARGGPSATIGMSAIKQRRLNLRVHCYDDGFVGDYVPFYFCPRSIMLYVIHRGNSPDLQYRDGQAPIIHFRADLSEVISWAQRERRRWAFSLSNAGAFYADFRKRIEHFDMIDWAAVAATDFRSTEVKEGKQAEFLIHEMFPWELVEVIGVQSMALVRTVKGLIAGSTHRPPVEFRPDWYY